MSEKNNDENIGKPSESKNSTGHSGETGHSDFAERAREGARKKATETKADFEHHMRHEQLIENSEIGRLRWRFIRIATIAIFVILVFLIAIINGSMGIVISIARDHNLSRIAGEQAASYMSDSSQTNSLTEQLIPDVSIGSIDYYVITLRQDGTVLSSNSHTLSDLTAQEENDLVEELMERNPTLQPDRNVEFRYGNSYYAARVVDKQMQAKARAEASASMASESAKAAASASATASESGMVSQSSGSSDGTSSSESTEESSPDPTPAPSSESTDAGAADESSASSGGTSTGMSSDSDASNRNASASPSSGSAATKLSAYNADGSATTTTDPDQIDVIFLDYTEIHGWQTQLLNMSVVIAILSLLIFCLVVISLSRRAIEPTIQATENQKRFITNASHELKTPVAIISADAEVLEAVNGENEWTSSIINQSKRLNELISALVQLTKASEGEKFELTSVDMTSVAQDIAQSFRPVIEQQGKTLTTDIAQGVCAKAEPKAISEVTNILLDNSAKYCDDGGMIRVSLAQHPGVRGTVSLTVSNDYADGASQDYTKFFERFYRADESHNSSKEGFGIGLAMAKELVTRMDGTMSVGWEHGRIAFTVTLH